MTYFHEEQRFGAWIWVIVAFVAFFVAAAVAGAGARPAILVGNVVVLALVAALLGFSRLDVDVDDAGVHIAFHLLWPTRHVALDEIKTASATSYSPLAWGGYGVHYLFLRGWSYNTGGHEGVLIETKGGSRIMVGSHRAKELEAAIAQAVAARAR